jgi:hypothetical protein
VTFSVSRRAKGLAWGLALAAGFLSSAAAAEPMKIVPPVSQAGTAPMTSASLSVPAIELPAPAPAKSRYNVVVFGDSLGDGVWAGLYHVFQKDRRISVIRKSRVATGFARQDFFDWNAAAREAAAEMRIDAAVIVMGTNDRQTIVENGERHALFEPGWRAIYDRRVDEFTATLKAAGARVYWVGLPVMRSPRFEEDMRRFNGIFAARAAANGVTFIPTHAAVAGPDGGYAAYGLDRSGRKKLLRTEDGIHFTMEGYDLLAETVGSVIADDLSQGIVTAQGMGDETGGAMAGGAAPAAMAGAIGLKAQIYDMAEIRPGRSDDWRWRGEAR